VHRLPLADELPYEFIEPKVGAFWLWIGRLYSRHVVLRGEQQVVDIDAQGLETITRLLERGDGVLITPNHQGHADCPVMLELSRRVGHPFYFMAAYQIFRGHGGLAKFMLPRIGAFPVDREGSDLRAFKTGVDILARGRDPLVIFPEGEVYHMGDRLTPIREGAAAVATTAAKRAAERDRTVWIVPMAMKYRFIDGHDPMPALLATMDQLESRFTWWPRSESGLVDRIYSYAEAMLCLKEMEYLGSAHTGPIKPRIVGLRDAILDGLEDRYFGKRRADDAPVRVKELRRVCLERLADPSTTAETKTDLRHALNDVFVALQLFSYPGDYLREGATVERVAETLMKFEQDVMGNETPPRNGPRRAIVRVGEPIDVRARMAAQGRPRLAVAAITTELEASLQALLDSIGPGRPIPGAAPPAPIPPRIQPALAV
jgi:hypothetical protein